MRWLKPLCLLVIALACIDFLISTVSVQIRLPPPHTDFASYYLAAGLLRQHRSPYDTAAFDAAGETIGLEYRPFPYLYPPPFALALRPLAALSYLQARQAWMAIGTVIVFLGLAATALLLRAQGSWLEIESRGFVWIVFAAFVPMALNSTSVHNDLRAGSVGVLLFLTMTLAAWALLQRRAAWAGGALAVAVLAKLVPVILLPLFWWRRERRAVGIALGLLAASMLVASFYSGFGIGIDWLQHAIAPQLRAPNGWAHNQSLDAYLLRLFDPSATMALPHTAPLGQRILSAILTLVILAVTLVEVARLQRPRGHLPVEVGFVVLAILITMRLTWLATLAAMLFVWPTLMLVILRDSELGDPGAARFGAVACVGFFLSSAHLPVVWGARIQHYPWLLLTGAHLGGMLILWGTCLALLRRRPRGVPV
jgi:hypothetical protein